MLSKNIYFGRYTNYIVIVQEAYPRHPGEFAPEVLVVFGSQKTYLRRFLGRGSAIHANLPFVGICRILFCWVLVRSPPSSCTLQSFQARGAQLSPENQPWLINGTCRRKDMEHRVWSKWKSIFAGGDLIVPGGSMVLNWGSMVVDDSNTYISRILQNLSWIRDAIVGVLLERKRFSSVADLRCVIE